VCCHLCYGGGLQNHDKAVQQTSHLSQFGLRSEIVTEHRQAETIRRIELLARRDPGSRGLASFADTSHLLAAAKELLSGERVILTTGFCIRAAMIGETDGPSGTLALADALRQLGKDVILVTDRYSSGLLAAGAKIFGAPFPIHVLSLLQNEADHEIRELLSSFSPTQVVAIERPGNALDGHRYSMRGEMLDDLVPAADHLLEPPYPRAFRTIGIGDGGNELGLGSLRDALQARVLHGELIFCATPADYVIPAGISNWGAFALVAALSLLSGKQLMRPPEHERTVLQALLSAGAVDGFTRQQTLSVDGLPWEDYASTIADIYEETRTTLN
jgi:hypothetical protein